MPGWQPAIEVEIFLFGDYAAGMMQKGIMLLLLISMAWVAYRGVQRCQLQVRQYLESEMK